MDRQILYTKWGRNIVRRNKVNNKLLIFQYIAFLHQRFYLHRRVVAKCLAQISNLHVQRQRVCIRGTTPDCIQQQVTVYRQIKVLHQQAENLCLTGSNKHFIISRSYFIGTVIEDRLAEMISLLLHRIGKLWSETFTNTGYKFFRIKRFSKIIIRTKLETLQTVGLITTVGKKEYEYRQICKSFIRTLCQQRNAVYFLPG